MSLNRLYEKIAALPPSQLPKLERFVDLLPATTDDWNDHWNDEDNDSDWEPPPLDENGKPVHPKAGCMKGVIVMRDNFFDPDDVWKEYR